MAYTETFSGNRVFEALVTDREKGKHNEVAYFENGHPDAHQGLFQLRLVNLPVSREIVSETYDRFVHEGKTSVVEFGSGAYGTFYNLLLPKRFKGNCTQYEVNPEFVKRNKWFSFFNFPLGVLNRHGKIKVGNTYDMPLEDSSVDVISGLSSWDSLVYLDDAMEEVYRCLRLGGIFVHFQDILPADAPLTVAEHLKREQLGATTDFDCEFEDHYDSIAPGLRRGRKILTGIQSVVDEDKVIDASSYLRGLISRHSKNAGLSILLDEKVQKQKTISRNEYERILGKFRCAVPEECNVFGVSSTTGRSTLSYDEEIEENQVNIKSTIDITVAQK